MYTHTWHMVEDGARREEKVKRDEEGENLICVEWDEERWRLREKMGRKSLAEELGEVMWSQCSYAQSWW